MYARTSIPSERDNENPTSKIVSNSGSEEKKKRRRFTKEEGEDVCEDEYVLPVFKIQKSNLPNGTSKEVEGFLSGIKGELIGTPSNRIHPNILQDEKEVLKELISHQKNRPLIIKVADKGGGIFLADFNNYWESCNEHL
ncbi:unnamed protein product [Lepeophtheirus salmonis]|uniref:(salmon louse) hypothetical protein n=1 Tax=Lepeophtheirus salmonis TaxID=72036 RepID=A0A7R8CEF9_LEPSM|nr:unnamed protein product [Lepeophtheirus salmonis]CAF2795154.1 unnamed protein product [Lepeophtheirus salmonis]